MSFFPARVRKRIFHAGRGTALVLLIPRGGQQPLGYGLHDLLVDLIDGEAAAVLVPVEGAIDGYGWSPAWASIARNWRCVR